MKNLQNDINKLSRTIEGYIKKQAMKLKKKTLKMFMKNLQNDINKLSLPIMQ